jgi:hypothetical protein
MIEQNPSPSCGFDLNCKKSVSHPLLTVEALRGSVRPIFKRSGYK